MSSSCLYIAAKCHVVKYTDHVQELNKETTSAECDIPAESYTNTTERLYTEHVVLGLAPSQTMLFLCFVTFLEALKV